MITAIVSFMFGALVGVLFLAYALIWGILNNRAWIKLDNDWLCGKKPPDIDNNFR